MENQFDNYINEVQSRFKDCQDFVLRTGGTVKGRFAVMLLRGLCDRMYVTRSIIEPLLQCNIAGFSGDFGTLLGCHYLKNAENPSHGAEEIAKGDILIIVESERGFYTVLSNAQLSPGRGVDEPGSDVTMRGPKAGFVENAEVNMALLRRIIRTPDLKFRFFTVGDISQTNVVLTYVEGRASSRFVEEIAKKLEGISASVVTDSTNVIMLLQKRGLTLFPLYGSTEKVDKAASKLMAGRVGIIVDGSPFAVTVPYLFIEGLQSSEDYLHTSYFATFIRALRFVAFLAAIFSPAVLCGVIGHDSSVMPSQFYGIIDEARQNIPITFFWEILTVLLLFEILREVGVRMPRTVGDAVGIVGSVILGNTAVEAGIVSSVGVIIVAFSAVCAFITPAYMYVIVLWRIVSLVLTELFGFYGLAASVIWLSVLLCCRKSFGVGYLTPLFPFGKKGMSDTVYVNPSRVLGRRERLGRHKK